VWSVHKSEEFRLWLGNEQPRVKLVFVPANCTSKLQVADVALQRPFKYGLTSRFNDWAAQEVRDQVAADQVVPRLKSSMSMKILKPLALQWCVESWSELRDRKQLILDGWKKCCTLYQPTPISGPISRPISRPFRMAPDTGVYQRG
jgi:hypothetical protein